MAMENGEVKLLGTWSSPFSLRIKWALKMKEIDYEWMEEDLSNKSPLLLKYNRVYKKIPVLVHDGKPITESLIILEYIDETWKNSPLLPEDPYERAMARFWAKFGEEKCMPAIWSVFIKQGKEHEEAMVSAMECLKTLEEQLKGKRFFGGETAGFTDISLGWIANMVGILTEITELSMIDKENFPLLSSWIENFSNLPQIEGSFPPQDKMVLKYRALRQALFASESTK
ncbi:hypothetical protein QJS04_geneDACA003473 [Acorus gramineus]|uniref:glutathione transferase n=1 Tax=Acorus gramineus TaxID=55184 RepID=A0AAV9BRZ9_ACOGR|nr:hypothetical protein QJS04_geneDACA003473 [Acorus gramineus]